MTNTTHETTYNVMLIMFTKKYTRYNDDITFHITLTSMSSEFHTVFTNDIFVDVSIYETIDHELCHHCFALPCECVQMDIMMTAKKD